MSAAARDPFGTPTGRGSDLGPDLLTIPRAAALAGRSIAELRALLAAGELPAVRLDALTVAVRRSDVEALRARPRCRTVPRAPSLASSSVAARIPVGSVVIMPDTTVWRVGPDGVLEPIAQGGHAHGLMGTVPVATRQAAG